jgi:serine/threonine protein kinase
MMSRCTRDTTKQSSLKTKSPLSNPSRSLAMGLLVRIDYSAMLIGFVFEAFDNNRKCKVALKRTQKAGNVISREYEILQALKGVPNVVQLLDFFYTLDSKNRIIQNSVFEFCDRSLEDVIKNLERKNSYLDIKDVKMLSKQLLNGLKSMHKLKIIHRDLKPENVLMKNGQVKICDFGSSKVIDDVEFKNTPYVVSRYYRAPELILACTKYSDRIDIWGKISSLIMLTIAVGCIIFELMTRTPMFPGDSEGLQLLEHACLIGTPTEKELGELKLLVDQSLLKLLDTVSPMPRQSMYEVFQGTRYEDKDKREAADLITQMVRWVPKERISAADAMNHPFLRDVAI